MKLKLESMEKLLVEELHDLHSAESQLIKALPKMAEACDSGELRACFESHLEETKGQLERIEHILEKMTGSTSGGKACKAMEGLISEGTERIKASGDPAVVDAGLISAAQRVEHYEIAAYGCAKTYAELLGDDAAARLLIETLEEEKSADQKLNDLAINIINPEAARA